MQFGKYTATRLNRLGAGRGEFQRIGIDIMKGKKTGQQVGQLEVDYVHLAAVQHDIYIDGQHTLDLVNRQRYDSHTVGDPHLTQTHLARRLG